MNELRLNYDLEKGEHAELKQKYDELSKKYKLCVLRIERVIASDANFKFYTI
jgi:Mor family transcriptional regulator